MKPTTSSKFIAASLCLLFIGVTLVVSASEWTNQELNDLFDMATLSDFRRPPSGGSRGGGFRGGRSSGGGRRSGGGARRSSGGGRRSSGGASRRSSSGGKRGGSASRSGGKRSGGKQGGKAGKRAGGKQGGKAGKKGGKAGKKGGKQGGKAGKKGGKKGGKAGKKGGKEGKKGKKGKKDKKGDKKGKNDAGNAGGAENGPAGGDQQGPAGGGDDQQGAGPQEGPSGGEQPQEGPAGGEEPQQPEAPQQEQSQPEAPQQQEQQSQPEQQEQQQQPEAQQPQEQQQQPEAQTQSQPEQQEQTQQTQQTQSVTRCTNIAGALNVRNAPSMGGSIVRTLGSETPVTVLSMHNAADGSKWAQIGTGQYVAAKYLKASCNKPRSITPSNNNNNNNNHSNGNKAEETLARIFRSEGRCQNWASDSGNKFQGKIGYTCMGVIPSQCWNNRNSIFSPLLPGFNGHPADFCKYAYDKNQVVFKQSAAQLYTQNYFGPGGCNPLPQPAFYVCADIAVNSGTGRSKQYIRELGGYNGQNAKQFARSLNEKHRADYIKWGCPTCKNRVFLKGWLARADERARYIESY